MEGQSPVAVIICCAGASSRMGGIKKEYYKPENSPESPTVLGLAVSAFCAVPSVEIIVIAVPQNGETAARSALAGEYLENVKPKIIFVQGGKTRQASVYNALCRLMECQGRDTSYVLIHDGARPWVSPQLIENIIKEVKTKGAVIPLLALTETPKECNAPAAANQDDVSSLVFISRHLKRANTGIAQTPQAFKFPEIYYAHKKAAGIKSEVFTDDAEIWGRFCGKVAVIPGEPGNRKITYKEDL